MLSLHSTRRNRHELTFDHTIDYPAMITKSQAEQVSGFASDDESEGVQGVVVTGAWTDADLAALDEFEGDVSPSPALELNSLTPSRTGILASSLRSGRVAKPVQGAFRRDVLPLHGPIVAALARTVEAREFPARRVAPVDRTRQRVPRRRQEARRRGIRVVGDLFELERVPRHDGRKVWQRVARKVLEL